MSWLLIHGLGQDERHWELFPATMSEALGVPVRGIDPPGFGTESTRRSPATIAAITDDVRRRFSSIRDDGPWSILGISLGGMIATDWCDRYPQDFDRLVVVNTSARPSSIAKRYNLRKLPAIVGARFRGGIAAERAILEIAINGANRDLDALAAQYVAWSRLHPPSPWSLLAQLAGAIRYHVPASIVPPTQVLTSDGDRLVNPSCSKAIAAYLDASLHVHPTAGHDLTMDEPEWVCDQIRRHP